MLPITGRTPAGPPRPIGRETDLERLVAGSAGRVVTVTGNPGSGKTALLVELARRLDVDGFGPAWLDVGRAEPDAEIAGLAAGALGLIDQPEPPAARVAAHLAVTGRVLLMDDAEVRVESVATFVHGLLSATWVVREGITAPDAEAGPR